MGTVVVTGKLGRKVDELFTIRLVERVLELDRLGEEVRSALTPAGTNKIGEEKTARVLSERRKDDWVLDGKLIG